MSVLSESAEFSGPIRAIYRAHDGSFLYSLGGTYGVTSIEPYDEAGEHGYVPWIKVVAGPRLIARYPAWCLELRYGD